MSASQDGGSPRGTPPGPEGIGPAAEAAPGDPPRPGGDGESLDDLSGTDPAPSQPVLLDNAQFAAMASDAGGLPGGDRAEGCKRLARRVVEGVRAARPGGGGEAEALAGTGLRAEVLARGEEALRALPHLAQADAGLLEYCDALFAVLDLPGPAEETTAAVKVKLRAVKFVLEALVAEHVAGREGRALTDTLNSTLLKLQPEYLPLVVDGILDVMLSHASCDAAVEHLPLCVNTVAFRCPRGLELPEWCEDLDQSDAKAPHQGKAFRDRFVAQLLGAEWPPRSLSALLGALREIEELTVEAQRAILAKAFASLRDVEIQELPAAVYQVLLYSALGCQVEVMDGLTGVFDGFTGVDPAILAAVQGTVLLHMVMAAKQDPNLGLKWLKALKTRRAAFTPFMLSMVFALASANRLQQPVVEFLTGAVAQVYKDQARLRTSAWLGRLECLQEQARASVRLLEAAFRGSGGAADRGWEHIAGSIAPLGAALLERGPPLRKVDSSLQNGDPAAHPPALRGSLLGMGVLEGAFDMGAAVQVAVLQICQQKIMSNSSRAIYFIHLLHALATKRPHLLLDHVPLIKETLEYFTLLPQQLASCLVLALLPLIDASRELEDYFVLILRKAMFARDTQQRLTAVNGIVHLLLNRRRDRAAGSAAVPRHLRPRASLGPEASQPSSSQRDRAAAAPRRAPDAFVLEMLGFLKRCMGQQHEVRSSLYTGLALLCERMPDKAGIVQEMLLPHLMHYRAEAEGSSGKIRVPFDFELCLSTAKAPRGDKASRHPPAATSLKYAEPLHHLLRCVLDILAQERRQHPASSAAEELAKQFRHICGRIAGCCLEDFGLDVNSKFDLGSVEGAHELLSAEVLLGVLEVVMEAALLGIVDFGAGSGATQRTPVAAFESAYTTHLRLQKLIGDKKPKPPKPKKGQDPPPEATQQAARLAFELSTQRLPNFSSRAIVKLLDAILQGDLGLGDPTQGRPTQHTQPASEVLPRDLKYQKFVLQTCLRLLEAAREGGPADAAVQLAMASVGGAPGPRGRVNLASCRVEGGVRWQDFARSLWTTCQNVLAATVGTDGGATTGVDALYKKAGRSTLLMVVLQNMKLLLDLGIASGTLLHVLAEDDDALAGPADLRGLVRDRILAVMCPMVKRLCDAELAKEAQVLVKILLTAAAEDLQTGPPLFAETVGECLRDLLAHAGEVSPALAKVVIDGLLRLDPRADELVLAVAGEAKALMGDHDVEVLDQSEEFALLDEKTCGATLQALIAFCGGAMDDVEHCLDSFARVDPHFRADLEHEGFDRLGTVLKVLEKLTALTIYEKRTTALIDSYIRCLTRAYKALGAAAKALIAPKGQPTIMPPGAMLVAVDIMCGELTPGVYDPFLVNIRGDATTEKQEKQLADQIKSASRNCPTLVFAMENCEKLLLELGGPGQLNHNLLQKAKRTVARDFRFEGARAQGGKENHAPPERSDADAGRKRKEAPHAQGGKGGKPKKKKGGVKAE